jgi:hypothetical protein
MTPIGTYGAPQRFIGVEYGAKTKRKNGGNLKTLADHVSMIERSLLVKAGGNIVAHYHGEISAGIAEHFLFAYALKFGDDERAPCSCAIQECLLLDDAVRVPRHARLSELKPGDLSPQL